MAGMQILQEQKSARHSLDNASVPPAGGCKAPFFVRAGAVLAPIDWFLRKTGGYHGPYLKIG
jgi:hypothetical protein